MKLSVVIPALNEEHGIGDVLREIPIARLGDMGCEVEVIVVDNGSIDHTAHIACVHGATVVVQPMRGYGNAYKAGFAYATGDVIATGDADLTYPFSDLPEILKRMEQSGIEFVNTDRLTGLRSGVMSRSHVLGNRLLSLAAKALFGWPYVDSQSGMWIFKRHVWDALNVQPSGMPFSQDIKLEAFVRGFRCDEVPIEYRARAGKAKLNTITDGLGNLTQLLKKRLSLGLVASHPATPPGGGTAVGRDSQPLRRAPAVSGNCAVGYTWDERWYDVAARADSSAGERGPQVPLPVLEDLRMDAAADAEPRRVVVWRAERRRRSRAERPENAAGVSMGDARTSRHTRGADATNESLLSPN